MRTLTPEQRELVGALVGLARSLDGSNTTRAAFDVMVGALRGMDGDAAAWTAAVREAKCIAVPDCSVCQNPCGRTADYDMDGLCGLDPELVRLKYELLEGAIDYAHSGAVDRSDFLAPLSVLQDALFAVGYDWLTAEQLGEKLAGLRDDGTAVG